MRIIVTQQDREVWVRVLANDLPDWPTVRANLTREQAGLFSEHNRTGYYPHWVTAAEEAEHGYSFDDTWIFTRPIPKPREAR